MTFLAQFDFSESKDIVQVPGEVLLLFTSTADICEGEPVLAFEWANGCELLDLFERDKVPEPAWPFVTCYGVRHRSCDFPSRQEFYSIFEKSFGRSDRQDAPREMDNVRVFEAVKIGGLPFWITEDEQCRRMAQHKFICSLCSVLPPSEDEFPWINQESPLSIEESLNAEQKLEIRAGAILNFFLTESDAVEWTVQFW
jgi:hypothetical protein